MQSIKSLAQSLYRKATSRGIRRLIRKRVNVRAPFEPVPGRLLYVASSAQPFHISGYTRRTHEVLRALKSVGADLRVLTRPGYPWDCKDSAFFPVSMETRGDGVVYRHAKNPSNYRPLLLYAIQASKVVEEVARRERAACIHAATNFLNALPALIAARRLGLPFQYEMRGLWELTRISHIPGYEDSGPFVFGLEFEGIVASEADRVFVISEQLQRFAQRRWGIAAEKMYLLPNCVDPDRILPTQSSTAAADTIGYAGSLVSYEGLDTLISAVDVLAGKGVLVKVDVIGDGGARSQLEAQVDRLGLRDRIRFFGKVQPDTAREILGRCSLVCIPRKPFQVCEIVPPIKLVEALAMGKPVIVPDLPVFRDEMGEDPAGWFFKAGDALDLATVIRNALVDHEALAALSVRAREYAITQRCWSDFVVNVLPMEQGGADGRRGY